MLAGGLLTTYASWRWVLFVNVPIGLVAALAAPRVLRESEPQRGGRFDLPGAMTGTGGLAALVYGLSNAATTRTGSRTGAMRRSWPRWRHRLVLLAAFAVIETPQREPLLPMRLLRDRNRTGANLIMLCVGAAIAACSSS